MKEKLISHYSVFNHNHKLNSAIHVWRGARKIWSPKNCIKSREAFLSRWRAGGSAELEGWSGGVDPTSPTQSVMASCWFLPFLEPKCSLDSTAFICFHLPKTTGCRTSLSSKADEKPGTICVWSSIPPGQDAGTRGLRDEVFIEFLPTDELTTSTTVVCEVTTLTHKS